MKKQWMLLGLATSTFLPLSASDEDIWKNTTVSFNTLEEHIINDKTCRSATRNFLACVLAIEEALKVATEDEFRFVTQIHLNLNPGVYEEPITQIGRVMVVKPVPVEKKNTVSEAHKAYKSRFEHHISTTAAVFYNDRTAYEFKNLLDWIHVNYITEDNEASVAAPAITKFLNVALDPHSYIAPQEAIEKQSSNNQEIFGIGVHLHSVENTLLIDDVVEDGPAYHAGLLPKDMILSVDDAEVSTVGSKSAIEKIKGEAGTVVKVKVQRQSKTLELQVKRGKVIIKNLSHRLIKHASGHVGYLKLRSFMPAESCRSISTAIREMKKTSSLTGWVLDLRDNGGGRLDQSACILGLFVGKGKVVIDEVDPENNEVLESVKSTSFTRTKLPLVVLINSGSASASEVVSGALKDYKRAVIVGERSFGKGTVQQIAQFSLAENTLIALTKSRFHLPAGWSNQLVGVSPDIEVHSKPNPSEEDLFAIRESDEFLPVPGSKKQFEYSEEFETFVGKTRECSDNGTALETYEKEKTHYFKPDFQLLTAMDVVECMDYVGFEFPKDL
jgi:carboxyl-terminal processing protease